VERDAAWFYASPSPGFEPLQGHLAVTQREWTPAWWMASA